jgi:hypothetical protein
LPRQQRAALRPKLGRRRPESRHARSTLLMRGAAR